MQTIVQAWFNYRSGSLGKASLSQSVEAIEASLITLFAELDIELTDIRLVPRSADSYERICWPVGIDGVLRLRVVDSHCLKSQTHELETRIAHIVRDAFKKKPQVKVELELE